MSMLPAPRPLFQRWVDDAAVFPPGNAPVPRAWDEHLALRTGRYADLVGPLLIGASGAASLADAAAGAPPAEDLGPAAGRGAGRVGVTVIARPGTPVDDLIAAVETLRRAPAVGVSGVEVAHDDVGGWRRALELEVPVAVEVARDPRAQQAALDEVAEAAGSATVLAKLRTQSTATAPVPTARELAAFMTGVRDRQLSFKLTGGLHHAVATTATTPGGAQEDQHGALNVLVATHQLEQGADLDDLVATLDLRDAESLATLARALDEEAVRATRARFVSFGCCGVTDPLGELAGLGLLA